MALTPISFLLLRNLSSINPSVSHSRINSLIRTSRPFWFSRCGNLVPFSIARSSLLQTETEPPKVSDPRTSLSDRMRFVFDQIDAIEKERSNKDEALQRIRAWREAKKKKSEEEASGLRGPGAVESSPALDTEVEVKKKDNLFNKEVEFVHPWPEWIEFMERLVQQNYFDHRRRDENKIIQGLSIDVPEFVEEGFDFTRDWFAVRTACLNFGRDRFDILRSLSRQDIQILVGYGCPNVDTKVVFSAKILRKHVHLDEGDVCSSCSLRSSCDRAYLLTQKEDEARTLDVIRILLAFGFDHVKESVQNKALLKLKSVKRVVRKLLHEVVKLSAIPIDPNLPPPVIKKAPPKVKQPPPPPKKRVGRDDIEMKKGDWLCPKCDFMNFAKNTVCLQCDAKRPKRQLLPGEWECPECNFLNYRRNMACFHCDHKRPPDEYMENQMQSRTHGQSSRLQRVASKSEISNAWNFDFDDNESDGADVAAFEFADPPKMGEESSFDAHAPGGTPRGFVDDSFETSRVPRTNERGYPDASERKSSMGFDDFDDEEDDIDSYELDTQTNSSIQAASSKDFSDVDGYSISEDLDIPDISHARQAISSSSYNNTSRLRPGNYSSESEDSEQCFDSDEELSAHRERKFSHIADSRRRNKGRDAGGPYRGITFGSDVDELDSGTDGDEYDNDGYDDVDKRFGSRSKSNKWDLYRRDIGRGGSESDGENIQSRFNKKGTADRRGNTYRSHPRFDSRGDVQFRSNSRMFGRRDSFGKSNIDRTYQGSRRTERGSQRGDFSGQRVNDRGGNLWNYGRRDSFGKSNLDRTYQGSRRTERGSQRGDFSGQRVNNRGGNLWNYGNRGNDKRFRHQQWGKYNEFNNPSDVYRDFDNNNRPRRRIIER
ncbi:PREDICTED: uncharacterized protein LOC104586372 [Nelumbo nucifera]|uniref:RanBP2-type domain-containing protein n=2 Tax=Nelumbo nucifera TaxID=4432 RepID=A0A822YGR6_NELNU|nr:PREDICTED: uncharacterized protein LOC104586372 [Nelumbo nucifera]DAD33384.1 TPA_asm: hypothetical protein HUJ06_012235 [Nelumbo nucifera]